ncbi:unnamed protein product [Tuber aestivum]|uniref:Uncharacterized protein n=1 Tax=Tuber aestivum TaxID=59557 RepID=A0A292Q3E7_9PEZI|nr:unnamed protein product [Tuber aestivum]
MRRCHQVNHSNRCVVGMEIGVRYLRKPPHCTIVGAVVIGALHFLSLIPFRGVVWGYLRREKGVHLPCKKDHYDILFYRLGFTIFADSRFWLRHAATPSRYFRGLAISVNRILKFLASELHVDWEMKLR